VIAQTHSPARQTFLGVAVAVIGLAIGWGATSISSEAGYAGVGPNFLPWVVALALVCCGFGLIRAARARGFADMDALTTPTAGPYWRGFVWMSAGLLLNALLITHIGFILSCALCFACAARGLRGAEQQTARGWAFTLRDALSGVAISAPVFWLFTQFLAISLPALTRSGWL
jgi:putative tricarboxylic transport membrane protein